VFFYKPYINYRFYRKQGIYCNLMLPFNLINTIPKDEQPDPKLAELDVHYQLRTWRDK
jgi:hypothetical protein